MEARLSIGGFRARHLLPVLITAAVFAVAFAGAHLPLGPAVAPSARAPSSVAPVRTSVAPIAEIIPSGPPPTLGVPIVVPDPLLPGLAPIVAANTVDIDLQTELPGPVLAASGTRLFYVAGGGEIRAVDLTTGASPQALVTVGQCQAIDQLAAAGTSLLYDVVSPVGLPPGDHNCGNPTKLGWTLWRFDLNTGQQAPMAAGETDSVSSWDELPLVHVALTPSAFAIERPSMKNRLAPVTIEVHAIDGRTLWSTTASTALAGLMLGGDRLAALTGQGELGVVDAAHAANGLRPVASHVGEASISEDGRYLAWRSLDTQDPTRMLVTEQNLDTSQPTRIASVRATWALGAPGPVVSSGADGPIVAWSLGLAGGSTAPAVVDSRHPGGLAVASPAEPIWIAISGDRLVWVAQSPDGSVRVLAVDLASIGT